MSEQGTQEFIRARAFENEGAAAKDKVLWSRHAIAKLVAEGLHRANVESALQTCQVIENYPTAGRPLPDCLVLGFWQGQPVHAVIAIDEDGARTLVVTVYVPSIDRWENGWKARKG